MADGLTIALTHVRRPIPHVWLGMFPVPYPCLPYLIRQHFGSGQLQADKLQAQLRRVWPIEDDKFVLRCTVRSQRKDIIGGGKRRAQLAVVARNGCEGEHVSYSARLKRHLT